MEIDAKKLRDYRTMLAEMETERQPWQVYWKDVADYILPRRYTSLHSRRTKGRQAELRNPKILDGSGTLASRTLAAGMMNGITSPARPWFNFRIKGLEDDTAVRVWLDECREIQAAVMAETNFYSSMAVVYLDLAGFATSCCLVYEDDEDVFRCYNQAVGEFFFLQDRRKVVRTLGRKFVWRVQQVVDEFGLENCSDRVKTAYEQGGKRLLDEVTIAHIIEVNDGEEPRVAAVHEFREIYWEADGSSNLEDGAAKALRVQGFRDWPAITPRWDTLGNDSYGTGPAMDALPDIMQLQFMVRRKAQAIEKMVSPPVVADAQLQGRPAALMPNGITYVAGANSAGVKPAYQVNPPVDALTADIRELQQRIREFFFNDLFRMISQLDTVRSATEIDARREEKLVLLGPVLERFEKEALDPAISRIFRICLRRGLFPPPPPSLNAATIEIEYTSILADAQRAVGAAPIERGVAFIGNLAGAKPEVMEIPNWGSLVEDYFQRLGFPQKHIKSPEEIAEIFRASAEQRQVQGAAQVSQPLTAAAKNLSETEVGGGASALQTLLGG